LEESADSKLTQLGLPTATFVTFTARLALSIAKSVTFAFKSIKVTKKSCRIASEKEISASIFGLNLGYFLQVCTFLCSLKATDNLEKFN